jgi:hypothetical protein
MKVTSSRKPRLLQSAVKALHRRSLSLPHRTDPASHLGGSGLSPFVTSPIEWATGQSLFTGAPLKGNRFSRGLVGGTVGGIGAGLPETRIIQAALHKGQYAPGAKPGVYKRNLITELLAAGGYPQKQLNLGLAHQLAQRRTP